MRKSVEVRIGPEGGRDAGKVFVITEMSATAAEKWGLRAMQALLKSGVDIPEDPKTMSLALVAAIGFKALASISNDEVDWLFDRLMDCVAFIPDPSRPEVWRGVGLRQGATAPNGPLMENDIEEAKTRLQLKAEAFEVTLGFSMAAVRSIFAPQPAAAVASPTTR
jgi:hypothetical protein